MTCHNCQSICKRFGKHRNGLQRYRCKQCGRTLTEEHDKPLNEMRISLDKALLCLNLLVEGNSIRSTERITGIHRDTVTNLLVLAGARCERLLADRIKDVAVRNVQADELWGYVRMKEKTKKRKEIYNKPDIGDAYTFVAIERHTKIVLAWHLGRRTAVHTGIFIDKLDQATSGRFQLTTDGFPGHADAVSYALGTRTDYAQLIKVYAHTPDETRYSPADITKAIPTPFWGSPFQDICTSHVERQNLTMRMMMRRLTRLTNAFSKKWENLRAALALHFAYYNFCRIHTSLRCTPAMEAEITGHIWDLRDLLTS